MKNLLICLLLIYSLSLVACPKRNVVESAARASYRLTGITANLIETVGAEYKAGIITTGTKNKLAGALAALSRSELVFIKAAAEVDRIHKQFGQIPLDQLNFLNKLFSEQIVAPFLEILKILIPVNSEKILAAVSVLRSTILFISNSFGEVRYG